MPRESSSICLPWTGLPLYPGSLGGERERGHSLYAREPPLTMVLSVPRQGLRGRGHLVHSCLQRVTPPMCGAERSDTGKSLYLPLSIAHSHLVLNDSVSEKPPAPQPVQQPSSCQEDPYVSQALGPSSFAGSRPGASIPGLIGGWWTSWEAGNEGDFLVGGSHSLQVPSLKLTEAILCPTQGPNRHLEFARRLC